MHAHCPTQTIPELYPIRVSQDQIESSLAAPVLSQITAAWNALDALEANLPSGPDHWQDDSLFVAREGMRRAWLAISNLDRSLRRAG